MRARRRKRLLEDIPTCKAQGVFIGLVELKGEAESSHPLTSHLAETSCVYYTWAVDEHWSRTVTEWYTDTDGKRKSRTKHESGWTTVADGGEMIAFGLRDESGAIRIRPEGATIEPISVFDETCGRGDPLYYEKGPDGAISDSDHRRRFHEEAIPVGAPLYVVGQAREREDIVAPEVARHDEAPMFLISTRSEKEVGSGLGWQGWGWGILGLVLVVGGAVVHRMMVNERDLVLVGAIGAGGYLLAVVGAWAWMVYNALVDLRQRVRQAWSLVDIQLKRRNDLIPNLVACVRGFRDYEATLQRELAEMRAQLSATPLGQPGPDPHACLPAVVTMAERYPELSSQESFLRLQEELADTEQRIALARSYFNDIASFYNSRIEVVPDRLLARLGRMESRALLTADGFERAPVSVEF
jgi:hypothetical protein